MPFGAGIITSITHGGAVKAASDSSFHTRVGILHYKTILRRQANHA